MIYEIALLPVHNEHITLMPIRELDKQHAQLYY